MGLRRAGRSGHLNTADKQYGDQDRIAAAPSHGSFVHLKGVIVMMEVLRQRGWKVCEERGAGAV